MGDFGDLLARLTSAVARTPREVFFSERLCAAYRNLAGASGAAVTAWYGEPHRVTLGVTDELSSRLEDLQDVVGVGPGHTAWTTGATQVGTVPGTGETTWLEFAEAAGQLVESAVIHAVPMRPRDQTFGVITLYQWSSPAPELELDQRRLEFLADAVGAALIRDGSAVEDMDDRSPWGSRAKVHQATGMLVARLHVTPEDALAVLRAHAYAHQSTLSEIAASVVDRRINFPIT